MRILLTGGSGFLGSSVLNYLIKSGYEEKNIFIPRSVDYDLTKNYDTKVLFQEANPDIVIHLAAVVGGIGANRKYPGEYFYDNMMMGMNVIEHSRRNNIEKFVQVGTVCSYPKYCRVPFLEDDMWEGFPEETNAPYGVAKKALGVMLKAYYNQYGFKSIVLLPCNLYGPNDNFDEKSSHVIPALIKKFVDAVDSNLKEVSCWGDGSATREFLHVDDAARGIVLAIDKCSDADHINLGSSKEITIRELAEMIKEICNFKGEIVWDSSMPNGQPRRMLDTTKAKNILGWEPNVKFHDGLVDTINWWINLQKGEK